MNPETPLEHYPDLAKAVGLSDLYFKREDLHPYGSHKGRSIPVMIDHYLQRGETRFAISSSGNAALAAALHVKKLAETKPLQTPQLDIFVGNHISALKLEKIKNLQSEKVRVLLKERPLQALAQAAEDGARSLRQSTDDIALIGYESLAEELVGGFENRKTDIRHQQKLGAVFIGTSSGTTAQALAEYFLKYPDLKSSRSVQVHIIQTSSCHPIADAFDAFDIPKEISIADAIVDRTALRKPSLVDSIKKTGGRGWCATNENIRAAQELVRKHAGLEISANSALSVAGAMQSAYMGYEIDGASVCMICGD